MEEDRLVKRKQKAKRDGNIVQLAQFSKELGDMYFETGRLRDALLEYHDQLTACEILNEKLNCAIAHRMIGEVCASLGDYEEALTHQLLHLEGAKEAENLLEQQRALATIGRTHFCKAQALPEGSPERAEACAAAKKSYSKSLRLCNDLENTEISLSELMTMRARLLLNLGLVLEEQNECEQAIELIQKAAELFRKHKVVEDLHRTHIALGALHERQGHLGLALRQIDQAIDIDDLSLKAVGQLTKTELLLRMGNWSEARQLLVLLYLSKDVEGSTAQQVQRLLRIVVTICRAEESLEVESDPDARQKLYETLGDAAAAVRAYEKALDYYQNMLSCVDNNGSVEQLSAALVSIGQTYRDLERYEDAIPYARRELSICSEASDICRSALNLADLLHRTQCPKAEVMELYNLATLNARKCDSKRLEASVLNDTLVYLQETGEFDEAEELRKKLDILGESGYETSSENDSENANIGANICLEDLSDVEAEMKRREEKRQTKRTSKRNSHTIKRNAKGETKLHVACIAGNVEEVGKLLEAHHPTNVRDYCGWTPLHEAANHGHVEIAELLIKSGANVDDPGGPMCGGVTPLHDAASCGHFSIMNLLMKSGANLMLKTREGDTILDCLEAWRSRSGDLVPSEEAEYEDIHSRLSDVVPKTKKSPIPRRKRDLDDLSDKEDSDTESIDVRRISAGEDYRRTIENVKNRFRPQLPSPSVINKKVTAPLVDSEDTLIDDWLEDDLNSTVKEKLPEERSSTGSKRKSLNSSDEGEKITKRSRIDSPEHLEINEVLIDENSCESNNSESSEIIFSSRKTNKFPPKKPKQISLSKLGFTRDKIESRTPSPLFNYNTDTHNNFERNYEVSESVKLHIRIGEEIIDLKLRFPEQRDTTVENLMKEIIGKFEDETGCRVQITLKTLSGDILLRENTLKNLRPVEGIIRLVADIVENEIPSMVNRYGKISKNYHIQSREDVLKCLKNCDNTSTFRTKIGQIMDDEVIPLLKCLEYQEKLQVLQLSGASLYGTGETLNRTLRRLTNLQELHLDSCDIDHNCLSCIEKLPEQLRILDLSYNPLGKKCENKLYELISHHRHLQTLNLRFCKLTRLASSEEWSSLVNLDLSWNPLDDNVTPKFLSRQMLSLNLSNTNDHKSSSIAREILDGLMISLRTLETLELSCCDLTDSDVAEILSKTTNLSKFNVSGNSKLTKKSVETLLKRKPSLAHIDASGCGKIVEIPEDVDIDDPRVCCLRVSMSADVKMFWLNLWRGFANVVALPHNVITFVPIVD